MESIISNPETTKQVITIADKKEKEYRPWIIGGIIAGTVALIVGAVIIVKKFFPKLKAGFQKFTGKFKNLFGSTSKLSTSMTDTFTAPFKTLGSTDTKTGGGLFDIFKTNPLAQVPGKKKPKSPLPTDNTMKQITQLLPTKKNSKKKKNNKNSLLPW
jgi:hypothetical protein